MKVNTVIKTVYYTTLKKAYIICIAFSKCKRAQTKESYLFIVNIKTTFKYFFKRRFYVFI